MMYYRNVFVDNVRVNVSINKDTNGDLLYLIGALKLQQYDKANKKVSQCRCSFKHSKVDTSK